MSKNITCAECGVAFDPADLTQVVFHETHRPVPELGIRGVCIKLSDAAEAEMAELERLAAAGKLTEADSDAVLSTTSHLKQAMADVVWLVAQQKEWLAKEQRLETESKQARAERDAAKAVAKARKECLFEALGWNDGSSGPGEAPIFNDALGEVKRLREVESKRDNLRKWNERLCSDIEAATAREERLQKATEALLADPLCACECGDGDDDCPVGCEACAVCLARAALEETGVNDVA